MANPPGLYFQSKSEMNSRDILLNPRLTRLIELNGMEARIRLNQSGEAMLMVQGTRGKAFSPAFSFPISQKEMATLMNGGMSSSDRKAYETFVRIVKDKFYPPLSMEYAEIGIGRRGWNNQTLVNMGGNGILTNKGWRSQNIDGKNVPGQMSATREVGGTLCPTAGFVYKGNLTNNLQQQAARNIQMEIKEDKPKMAERPADGHAKKLDGTAKSAGNDTFLQLKEILATHGIDIDEKKKVMYIRPLTARVDVRYNLKDEDLKILTANNWRAPGSIEKRLDVINAVIGKDFNEKITRQMLNKDKNYINLTFTPDAKEYYEKKFIDYDKQQAFKAQVAEVRRNIAMDNDVIERDEAAVNGYNIEKLLPGKAFFANQAHGRQLLVGEVRVDRVVGDGYAFEMAKGQHELVKHYGLTREMVNCVNNKAYAFEQAQIRHNLCIRLGITEDVLKDGTKLSNIKDQVARMADSNDLRGLTMANVDKSKILRALIDIDRELHEGDIRKYVTPPSQKDYDLAGWSVTGNQQSLMDKYNNYRESFEQHNLVKEFGVTKNMDDMQRTEILGKIDDEIGRLESTGNNRSRMIDLELLKNWIETDQYEEYIELPKISDFGISKREADLMEIYKKVREDILNETDSDKKAQLIVLQTDIERLASGRKTDNDIIGLDEPKRKDFPDDKTHYTMSAMINGQKVTRDITENQYRKFYDKSDASRLKYFAEIFSDKVDLYKADYVFKNDVIISDDKTKVVRESDAMMAYATSQSVDPALLKEFKANKGWYAEKGDRQKDVRDIRVMADPLHEGKFKITAVIDTKNVSYEMSAKDYEKFMKANDLGRMKIFSRISPEVEIKTDPDKKVTPARVLALIGKSVAALAMGPSYWGGDYDRRQYVDMGYNRYRPGHDRPHTPLFAENNDRRAAADAQVAKALPTPTLYEMAISDEKNNENQIQQQSQGRGMG